MDPLSITATAITIVQLSGTIITTCYAYRSRVKNAAKDASRIIKELNNLRDVLEVLFQILEREASDDKHVNPSALERLTKPDGPLAVFEAQLKDMEKKLEPIEGWRAAKAALFWPLQEPDVAKLLDDIERTKSTVQLALQATKGSISCQPRNLD